MSEAVIDRPVLRIVHGEPTAEEMAILTALAASRGGTEAEPEEQLRGGWADPSRRLAVGWRPGTGAWRNSH